MRRWLRLELGALIVGVMFLAGAVYDFHDRVWQSRGWPRADAEIAGSRAVERPGLNGFSHEMVLRYQYGDGTYERTILGNRLVPAAEARAIAERRPVGNRVPIAINPADPLDIRVEPGATEGNLLGAIVLASLGSAFVSVFVVFTWLRTRQHPSAPDAAEWQAVRPQPVARPLQIVRVMGTACLVAGAIAAAIALVLLRTELDARGWPTVTATVVDSRVVSATATASSSSTRNARATTITYDAAVTFRYTVDGVTFESTTGSGLGTGSEPAARELAARYAPGTTHAIAVNPADPYAIRYDAGWQRSRAWPLLAGGLLAIAFLASGVMLRRLSRRALAADASPPADREAGDVFSRA